MDRIYSEAYLNLSADWPSKEGGLFRDREPVSYQRLELDATIPPARAGDIQVSGRHRFSVIDVPLWHQQVSLSPLNRRGWVLQERLLARRVIHFGCREILWECRERTLSESFPHVPINDNFDQAAAYRTLKRFRPPNFGTGFHESTLKYWNQEPRSVPTDFKYLVWFDIVKDYSYSDLTRGSDKLVAISGVAKYMKPFLNDTYVLGLWTKFLAGELLWRCGNRNSKRKDYRKWIENCDYRSPSFSWASIDGDISPGQPLVRGLLVQVQCIPYRHQVGGRQDNDSFTRSSKSLDPVIGDIGDIFGPALRPIAEVRVTGFLRRMRLRRRRDKWSLQRWTDDSECEDTHLNLDFEVAPSEQKEIMDQTFYYMCWDKFRYPPPEEDFAGDLMLLRLEDPDMGRFRRIGTAYHWSYASSAQEMEDSMELYLAAEDVADRLPCWRYDAKSEKHTIFLV